MQPPHVVNSTSCTCGCPKPSTLSKKDSLIKQWNNATCQDECKESTKQGDGADNGQKAFNATTCTYECKNVEPVEGCGIKDWYDDTCSCRCSNGIKCEFPFITDDNLCDCACGLKETDAPVGKFLNNDFCALECIDKKPVFDEKIKFWNETSCAVECINKELKIDDNISGPSMFEWDEGLCENVCISQAPNPQPPNSRWNPKTCMTECTEPCRIPLAWTELDQKNPDCTCYCLTELYCPGGKWSQENCECYDEA